MRPDDVVEGVELATLEIKEMPEDQWVQLHERVE